DQEFRRRDATGDDDPRRAGHVVRRLGPGRRGDAVRYDVHFAGARIRRRSAVLHHQAIQAAIVLGLGERDEARDITDAPHLLERARAWADIGERDIDVRDGFG